MKQGCACPKEHKASRAKADQGHTAARYPELMADIQSKPVRD